MRKSPHSKRAHCRRGLLAVAPLALLIVLAVPALGGASAPHATVAGQLTMPNGERVIVSARFDAAEPAEGGVEGSILFNGFDGWQRIDVNCGFVNPFPFPDGEDRIAVVGGTVVGGGGEGWVFEFIDGGPGDPDQVMYEPLGPFCSPAPPFLFTATQGNVVIHIR